MQRFIASVPAGLALWLPLICGLSGCQLPDVSAFADAVATTSTGVETTGQVFVAEARRVGDAEEIKQFEEDWAVRVSMMRALSEYADSLAAVTAAGESGKAAVEELGTALDGMMSVFGASGIAGSVAFRIGGEIYELAAQAAAAATLEKAVTDAGPVIIRACELIDTDLTAIGTSLPVFEQAALGAVENDEWNAAIQIRRELERQRRKLVARLDLESMDEAVSANLLALEEVGADAALLEETRGLMVVGPDAELLGRLEQLEGLISEQDAVIARTDAAMAEVARRFRGYAELIGRTRSALDAISANHGKIATALRENRTLSMRSLKQAATQLLATAERIRLIEEETRD